MKLDGARANVVSACRAIEFRRELGPDSRGEDGMQARVTRVQCGATERGASSRPSCAAIGPREAHTTRNTQAHAWTPGSAGRETPPSNWGALHRDERANLCACCTRPHKR